MDTARDLACADVWQASLERSLARRGKPTRSSLELFHLRPERDLSCVDILRESTAFSEMRRSADIPAMRSHFAPFGKHDFSIAMSLCFELTRPDAEA